MPEKKVHTLIVRISILIFIVSAILFLYSAFGFFNNSSSNVNDWLVIFSGVFVIYSATALISAYAIKYQDKRWLKKLAKSTWFLLPLLMLLIAWKADASGFIAIIRIILLCILTYLVLIHLYLYTKPISLTGTLVLLCIMLLGMFLKRNYIAGAGFAMLIGCGLLSVGSLMFAIRCLFLSENQVYFRNITFFGGIILSLSFLGSLFKLQHWPGAGPLLMTSFVLLILGTVFLLFTIHSSGIIEWSPVFKKIFTKILIPWAFIFFIYFSRFLIPDLFDMIWAPNPDRIKTVQTTVTGFGMKDYAIEDKNGLGPIESSKLK